MPEPGSCRIARIKEPSRSRQPALSTAPKSEIARPPVRPSRRASLKGYRRGGDWRVVLGLRIFERDPADALFFWRESRGFPRRSYNVSFAWKMATVDPALARRVIGSIPGLSELCDTPVYLALAEVGRDEAAVRRLMDKALQRMDRWMADPLRAAGQPIGCYTVVQGAAGFASRLPAIDGP
jgi:hypothetical protein